MKCSLFLLLLVSTLSAITSIDLGMQTCVEGIWTDATPSEGGTVVGVELPYVPMPPFDFNGQRFYEFIAYPNEGYVFSHWLKDGNEIIEDPHLLISYATDPNAICVMLIWPPAAVFSAVFNKAPVLDLETFYESNSGESITIDATPTGGYPPEYFYQWYFNESPIQSQFGGTGRTFTIDGASHNNATWRVEVTNEVGTTSAEFEYRVFTDADSDGLSDYREDNILYTDPNLADSDSDGLNDYDEVNTHSTNPNLNDTDTDGLSDGAEVNTYSSNPLESDSDGDGLADGAEVNNYNTDPNDTDSDDDQLSDADEVNTHLTNPNLSDTDSDQLSDYSEINSHLTDPNDSDSDNDGLGDGTEVITYTTNPLAADTSGDGFTDGFVVTQGADPLFDYSAFRTETVNQMLDLRIGSTMIEVSEGKADITMTLEETSNLTDWSNADTSEKTIEVDAPPGTRFYRFKIAD